MRTYNNGKYIHGYSNANHWNAGNTDTLIAGLSGIAGAIIADKQAGKPISAAENQLANLSAETLAALNAANNPQPKPVLSLPMILVGAVALILIGVVLFYKKR